MHVHKGELCLLNIDLYLYLFIQFRKKMMITCKGPSNGKTCLQISDKYLINFHPELI